MSTTIDGAVIMVVATGILIKLSSSTVTKMATAKQAEIALRK
jgi:hypothetical protein